METPTIEAAAILTFFFVLSLLGAYVVLRLLRGTAKIQRKGVQLGGAAAMFVVMFVLLNKYLPEIRDGIVQEASAAAQSIEAPTEGGDTETVEVQLSPATQLTTEHDLRRLDRNNYAIRDEAGFAVPIPTYSDLVLEEVEDVAVVGIADIPFFGQSVEMMKTLFNLKSPTIVAVRTRTAITIEITEESRIGRIPVDFNPFEDEDYVKASIKAAAIIYQGLGIDLTTDDMPEELIETMRQQFLKQFAMQIQTKLPVQKDIRSGVFVIPLTNDLLNLNLINQFSSISLLDKAMMFLQGSGSVGTISFGNMYMNQQKGLASFNTSTTLEDVLVDGKLSDIRVNMVGFLVSGNQRVFLVLLIYLSNDDVQVFRELEQIFHGLRFAG